MTRVFIVNSILLGIGLAMDAFSVSMADGMNEPGMKRCKIMGIAGCFAFFQFLMPLIGWLCVHTVAAYFTAFQKFIPWIALILLLYIGGKMLFEGIRGVESGEEEGMTRLGKRELIVQGIATSIDALSVGFTIAEYNAVLALIASLIIAVVTYVICYAGVHLGRRFGTLLQGRASILGGVILIGIGVEIFIRGM